MRQTKHIFSLLASSLLILPPFGLAADNHSVNADVLPDDTFFYSFVFPEAEGKESWRYTVLERLEGVSDSPCIELDCYLGSDNIIVLPSKIDGLPVVSVDTGIISHYNYDYRYSVYVPDSIKHFEKNWIKPDRNLFIYSENGDEYRFTDNNDYDYYYYDYDWNYYEYDSSEQLYFSLTNCFPRINIDIPETIFGLKVEAIDGGALNDCYMTEEVSFPDTVKYMSLLTYMPCIKLKKLKLPKEIKVIPPEFFKNMPALEELILPEDLIFMAKNALPEDSAITPPEDKLIDIIGYSTDNFRTFTVYDPETLWCYYISVPIDSDEINATLIYAPDLTGDPPKEFMGYPLNCDIHENPPYGMPVITVSEKQRELYVGYEEPVYVEKLNIYSNDITIESPGLQGSKIRELDFPGSADICSCCFTESHLLESVRFSGEHSWINIGRTAFFDNKNLTELIFPKECSHLRICDIAFQDTSIKSIVFPEGDVQIDDYAFKGCTELKDVVFGDGIKINDNAFLSCSSLENITFKGSADIKPNAFENCQALKNINIDPSLRMNSSPFNGCISLETINGESPFKEDGSPQEKYIDFIENNLYDSDNNGIINKYVLYRVRKTVAETITDDMNDMQKVKALHDKLCDMVYYDTGNNDLTKNHTDVSVFLNESSVCDGYARAMNLLLHEAGIKSCYVYNPAHAWVIAEIGCHYFHVDPTWDDLDTINYEWFMKTDDQIKTDPDHATWKIRKPTLLHDFQWESIPACNEKMGDVNGDSIVDGRDASDILAGYAKTSVGEESGIDAVLADYDFSGTITAVDASCVLKKYSEDSVKNTAAE